MTRSSGSVPEVPRPAGGGPLLGALERRLRSAILSPDAGERLIQQGENLGTTNNPRSIKFPLLQGLLQQADDIIRS